MDMAGRPSECFMEVEDLATPDHLKKVAQCQYFIGHKTHSTIFALLSGTPLIGICYHPKTKAFMKQFGVERFAIDDSCLSFSMLKSLWEEIQPVAEDVSSYCFSEAAKMANDLELQMKEVLVQVK